MLLVLLGCIVGRPEEPTAPTPLALVEQMGHVETSAVKFKKHFLYRRKERSTRTKGHLWEELVVEISAGRMRRLVSIDGTPLTPGQAAAEDARIQSVVRHPDELAKDSQGRKDDEARTTGLLNMLPKAFLFNEAGTENGCIRILFKPNPTYQEQSYQERVIHAAAGTLLIHPGDDRLCSIDAHLDHEVDFGYGLLGKVTLGSGFSMTREQVEPGQWKTTQLHVHIDGNVLMMKTVSRQEDSEHFGFQEVPYNMSIPEAASLLRTTGYSLVHTVK